MGWSGKNNKPLHSVNNKIYHCYYLGRCLRRKIVHWVCITGVRCGYEAAFFSRNFNAKA